MRNLPAFAYNASSRRSCNLARDSSRTAMRSCTPLPLFASLTWAEISAISLLSPAALIARVVRLSLSGTQGQTVAFGQFGFACFFKLRTIETDLALKACSFAVQFAIALQ